MMSRNIAAAGCISCEVMLQLMQVVIMMMQNGDEMVDFDEFVTIFEVHVQSYIQVVGVHS